MTDMISVPRSTLKELVEMASMHLVFDGMGVYPQSFDGVPRTEKQEGWNDAMDEILRRSSEANAFFDTLPVEKVLLLISMIYNGSLFLFSDENGKATFAINCNDTFAPAADCESVEYRELEAISDLYKTHGFAGVVAFAAMKRKDFKLFRATEAFTKDFEAAVEALRAKEMFDLVHPKVRDESNTSIVITSLPAGKSVWYELFKGLGKFKSSD